MGILNDVMQYRANKEAQREQQANAIPQALLAYQSAKQQQQDNLLKQLTVQATLAKSGLALGPGGQLVKDPTLSQDDVLNQMLKAQKINTLKSKESLFDKMIKESNVDVDPAQVLATASKNTGIGKEDFNVKPLTRMVAGVPHTSYVPELKNQLPAGLEKEYRGFGKVGLALSQNLRTLNDHPEFDKLMSPTSIKAMRPGTLLGNIGNFLLKIDPKSKDFATFKAETDKTFQAFRKETTGAQAALAELGWLAPDYPEVTDNPELYKQKAKTALERIAEGEKLMLDNWGAQGYRTSQLKKVKSPAKKSVDLSSMSDDELKKLAGVA